LEHWRQIRQLSFIQSFGGQFGLANWDQYKLELGGQFERIFKLEHIEDDKKKTHYDLIDTYIWDAKGRKTYAG
jgi:hypothetical protein